MDKFSQLLEDSQFSKLVLGNESSAAFILVDDRPWPDEVQSDIERRGLRFAGVLGVVQGRPRAALAVPMDAATIDRLSREFCRDAAAYIDPVEWLAAHLANVPRNKAEEN